MTPQEQAEYKRITGENTPAEYNAFTRGYEAGQAVIMRAIREWDGTGNSEFAIAMRAKIEELKDKL